MCGIFGMTVSENSPLSVDVVTNIINTLFKLSESRGKEAAGIAVFSDNSIAVYKEPLPASKMINTSTYKKFLKRYIKVGNDDNKTIQPPFTFIGHSRLVTDGLQGISYNNQPVVKDDVVCVHNGIIVNVKQLWNKFPQLKRKYEIDTEIIASLIRLFFNETNSLPHSLSKLFSYIYGSASIAFLLDNSPFLGLATNTGSLYLLTSTKPFNFIIFASELYIIKQLASKQSFKKLSTSFEVFQLKPMEGLLINLYNTNTVKFQLNAETFGHPAEERNDNVQYKIVDLSMEVLKKLTEIKRCTKCILPETFPFIKFNQNGECNYCEEYKKIQVKGHDALEKLVSKYRRTDGQPDCIVAFSGGRDSSYMLHYIKTILKMNPVAYTYDWGMVTDLARRNQARICGKLGIEHIIVSADIKRKRKNIQRNVKAWLKKPSLGMIPLFMAGDKQYFYYAHKLRKQLGVKLVFLGGNPLEKTNFKTGFCGVKEAGRRPYDIPLKGKLQMVLYYLKQFIINPSYINPSLIDTLFAFYSSYISKHDFVWFYQYIKWDESEIMKTLKSEYDWEVATDTDTTWRIGDGTAAFYNYIYYTVAGFTEIDTFRSNQIREGMISREEAIRLIQEENKPRYDSIREYTHLIGIDCEEALYVINSMDKLYIKNKEI